MSLRPEQTTARRYLREKGSLKPVAEIRERIGAAFAAVEALLDGVAESEARARPGPGEWSVHEIVDHLVETHLASLDDLRDLLRGRRPPAGPIPAGLRSRDPWRRPWPDLLRALREVHAETLEVLAGAGARDDDLGDARAPVVMVAQVREPDGGRQPLHWIEELDWKAYAIVFRLHALDHLSQAKRALRASP